MDSSGSYRKNDINGEVYEQTAAGDGQYMPFKSNVQDLKI
jgi:hypothetical protein